MWGDYGNGFWEGDQIRDSYPPKDPNKGIEADDVYDAAIQKVKRDEVYDEVEKIFGLIEQRANADITHCIIPALNKFEEWSYRRRPIPDFKCREGNSKRCFIGEPIRTRGRLQHPVRQVTFRLVTRDQGFIISSARGSQTWYTVGVIPAGQDIKDVPEEREETDTFFSEQEYAALTEQPTRFLHLYRNQHARYDYDINTVVWSADSSNKEQAEWVKALKVGDRIVIQAYAKFEGWENRVRCISVTVHNTVTL